MTLYEQLNQFQEKLNKLEAVLIKLYKLKKPLLLTIKNCKVTEKNIFIEHCDIVSLKLTERDLENVDVFEMELLTKQNFEEKKKKIYDLQFQIKYWTDQTSLESITKKQQYIKDLQVELAALEGN